MKFGGRERVAHVLGTLAAELWLGPGKLEGYAAVVPVPLSAKRRRERGFDIFHDAIAARRSVGYLPETPPLYPEMSVRSYLTFVARIKDVKRRARGEAVDRALERPGEVFPRTAQRVSAGDSR